MVEDIHRQPLPLLSRRRRGKEIIAREKYNVTLQRIYANLNHINHYIRVIGNKQMLNMDNQKHVIVLREREKVKKAKKYLYLRKSERIK